MNGIAQQTSNYMKGVLEDFCYEFYEHLDDYTGVSIKDITDAVVEGLNDFHSSIDREDIEKRISDANDDLEPPEEY
jgi:hypothetical protein